MTDKIIPNVEAEAICILDSVAVMRSRVKAMKPEDKKLQQDRRAIISRLGTMLQIIPEVVKYYEACCREDGAMDRIVTDILDDEDF